MFFSACAVFLGAISLRLFHERPLLRTRHHGQLLQVHHSWGSWRLQAGSDTVAIAPGRDGKAVYLEARLPDGSSVAFSGNEANFSLSINDRVVVTSVDELGGAPATWLHKPDQELADRKAAWLEVVRTTRGLGD